MPICYNRQTNVDDDDDVGYNHHRNRWKQIIHLIQYSEWMDELANEYKWMVTGKMQRREANCLVPNVNQCEHNTGNSTRINSTNYSMW